MQAFHVGVVHKDAPCSDKMQAVASSSQDLPLRNRKERLQWQRAEGAPVSQNRGYDPQKHREMSKPYLRTWCTLLVSWGLEVGFCATLAGVRYLHRDHPSHLPPGDVGRVRGATCTPSNPPMRGPKTQSQHP